MLQTLDEIPRQQGQGKNTQTWGPFLLKCAAQGRGYAIRNLFQCDCATDSPWGGLTGRATGGGCEVVASSVYETTLRPTGQLRSRLGFSFIRLENAFAPIT